MIFVVALSGGLGYYFAGIVSPAKPASHAGNTVNLLVVPDYGGAGYDAFVLASNINSTAPQPGTNSTKPGPNDNNITVSAGVPVKFVISSVDSAILQNFTGSVSTPFAVYNDTESGQVAVQYTSGQQVSELAIGHTFTMNQLGINIPIPPLTMVVFTYTFAKPGVYLYECETPCGPGMGLSGYMQGYIVVK
jgi:heme/copper-type cytochrome/quinol oxidase subunit 2